MSLILREYAFLSSTDARKMGIPLDVLGGPTEVGLLFCVRDYDAAHVTVATGDADYVRTLATGVDVTPSSEFRIPDGMFRVTRRGWPEEWGAA
jgi:hypothetical protein